MRHTATLIAGIVIAPLAWILIAFGQDRSAQAFANAASNGGFHTGDFLRPLLFLAAAGILLGLIATLRVSPVGAMVAGAVYTASYALLLVTPKRVVNLLPHHLSVAGRDADLSTPLRTGTALLIGVALLVAAASVGRWRRWPVPAGALGASDALDPLGSLDSQTRPLGADGLTTEGTASDSFSGFGASGFDETRYDGALPRRGDLTRTSAGQSDENWVDALRGGRDSDRTGG